MTPSLIAMSIIFGIILIGAIAGIYAGFHREMDLEQWTVGGRGFGFTGGHFHRSWGNDDLRKLVLNAILWTAKIEVPNEGIISHVTAEDLRKNLDAK